MFVNQIQEVSDYLNEKRLLLTIAFLKTTDFFYCLDKFRQVKIRLEHHLDIKRFIKSVLESCSLPTANVDKLKEPFKPKSSSGSFSGSRDYYAKSSSSNFTEYDIFSNIQRARQEKTLR